MSGIGDAADLFTMKNAAAGSSVATSTLVLIAGSRELTLSVQLSPAKIEAVARLALA